MEQSADNREHNTFESRGDMPKKHDPLSAKHPRAALAE
jgi:hypothetical protein